MIEELAERIVKMQLKMPMAFIIVAAIITIALVPGIFKLVGNVEPSLEKVLPQDVEEVKTMNDMRTQFGADMMYLVVKTESPVNDIREPLLLKYIDILSEKLRTQEHILEINNIADIVKEENRGIIPESLIEVKEILRLNPITPRYVNDDYSITIIEIRSDTGNAAEIIKEVVDKIKIDIMSVEELNPGAKIEITGFNAIDKATFEVIISDFGYITIISMVLVGIVVFITFRSFNRGMMPMIVVMTAIIWTMGIIGYLGLTITVVTMVAAAMIMGLGIDFGIHIVYGYFKLKEEKSKTESIKETMKELLRAMIGASFTTIAGFLALLSGVLPAMKILGIILAIGIFNTLIGAIFLLPVILIYYDKIDNRGSRLI